MPRRSNTIETVQVTISTSAQVRDLLETLARTGLYGRNPAEAASQLIQDRLRTMITSGELHSMQKFPVENTTEDPEL